MVDQSRRHEVNAEAEVPTLAEWIHFLGRQWLLIVSCSVGAAIIVALSLTFIFPPQYEATGTVVVLPSQFSSALRPGPLSLQGYQRLLESDAVVGETARRLVEEGVLADGETANLRGQLRSRIFVASRAEQVTLAPIIEVRARADDGETAAFIANTWAEAFLDSSEVLFGESVARTSQLIEKEYLKKQDQVRELEQRVVEAADRYQARLDEAIRRWDQELHEIHGLGDRRLAAHRKETEELFASHQLESRNLIEALVAEQGPQSRTSGQDQSPPAGEEAEPPDSARAQLALLVTLRTQLSQTPRFRSIERSISDESLWQVMAMEEAEMLKVDPLLERTLESREPNPLYDELSLRVAEATIALDALNLDPGHSERIRSITRAVEVLQRRRSASLVNLVEDRTVSLEEMRRAVLVELAEASRQRRQELDALERERDRDLGDLARGLRPQVDQLDDLASNLEEAALAGAEESQVDVRMGSRAIPSLSPRPAPIILASFAALFFGAVLGVFLGVVREVADA